MVGTSLIEVKCVKCNTVYESQVIDHLDMSTDFELAKSFKTGRITRAQCPKCKKVMYLERSIVINFEPESLIVFFDPAATSKEAQAEIQRNYDSVARFNETLEETVAETEFKVITDLDQLRALIDDYGKKHK
jgi:hypothetical protein